MSRSASVDLPWSTCAMIEKLRIRSMVPIGSATGAAAGRDYSRSRQRRLGSVDWASATRPSGLREVARDALAVEGVAGELHFPVGEDRDAQAVAALERDARVHVHVLERGATGDERGQLHG